MQFNALEFEILRSAKPCGTLQHRPASQASCKMAASRKKQVLRKAQALSTLQSNFTARVKKGCASSQQHHQQ